MPTIEELERRVAALQDELRAAQAALHQARLDACPVKVGMTVRRTGQFSGLFMVAEVRPETAWGDKMPWVVGNPQKADGTWGTARRYLYDRYEVVP
jgi:hypothetical protein